MYFLITATFPDFTEHNQVFSTRFDIKASTIQNSLVARFNFFERASCEVSRIERWEAVRMCKFIPHATNIPELFEILEGLENQEIYKKNKKQ